MLQFLLGLVALAGRRRRRQRGRGLEGTGRRHAGEVRCRRRRVGPGDDRPLERVVLADEMHRSGASVHVALPRPRVRTDGTRSGWVQSLRARQLIGRRYATVSTASHLVTPNDRRRRWRAVPESVACKNVVCRSDTRRRRRWRRRLCRLPNRSVPFRRRAPSGSAASVEARR